MLTIPRHGLQKTAPDIPLLLPLGLDCVLGLRRPVVHRFGSREVHPACRRVLVQGVLRRLQPRPFDLLVHLIENRDRVLSTDELLNAVWHDRDVHIGSLATAIARIRAALCEGERDDEAVIETHHRVGYRFVAVLDGDVGGAS